MGLAVLGGLYVSWGGLAAARRRVLCFGAALALLFLSLNGPLHNLSDCCLFSAHMVQHLLLTLAFPPLLLYGTPAWVIRPLYPFYESAPRVWGLAPLADQQLGGLLMWVVGTIYLWVTASVVWFRWSAREESGDVERAVPLEAYGNATRPLPSPPVDAPSGPL